VTENGHVFSTIPDPEKLLRRDDAGGKLIGVKKASTFTGFCGKHDQEIFRELDKEEFDGKASKTFLVAYRTLCRELFAKEGHLNSFDVIRGLDKGRPLAEQLFIQDTSLYGSLGAKAALSELQDLKARYDNALLTGDHGEFAFKNFRFGVNPDIVSAGGFNPTHNLSGVLIQDLSRLEQNSENLFFSILPTQSGFWVSFSWPAEYQLMKDFVAEFERIATIGTSYGVALAFVENTFLKPSKWQSLTEPEKNTFTRLSLMGAVDDDYSALSRALSFLSNKYPTRPVEIIASS
jgi:hypothetical protein